MFLEQAHLGDRKSQHVGEEGRGLPCPKAYIYTFALINEKQFTRHTTVIQFAVEASQMKIISWVYSSEGVTR